MLGGDADARSDLRRFLKLFQYWRELDRFRARAEDRKGFHTAEGMLKLWGAFCQGPSRKTTMPSFREEVSMRTTLAIALLGFLALGR